jgi:PTH1 family peptidyl-tRNA hydrolase
VYLVVGLGNPGKAYEQTRHNVGFLVVDRLAEAHSITVRRQRFHSLWGKGVIARHPVILAKPQTFMNRSGQALAALKAYFELAAQDLLVIHDDLDVGFGRIKIVRAGGAGGHRGVQSVHQVLASDSYVRVKVGIGRPKFHEAIEDYVLSPWYEDQRDQVIEIVDSAAAAVTAVFTDGLEKTMTMVNARNTPLSAT